MNRACCWQQGLLLLLRCQQGLLLLSNLQLQL